MKNMKEMKEMSEPLGVKERIKERIAKATSEKVREDWLPGQLPCIIVFLGEPKMPNSLFLEDSE